jgi:hypothetical protein
MSYALSTELRFLMAAGAGFGFWIGLRVMGCQEKDRKKSDALQVLSVSFMVLVDLGYVALGGL